MEDSLSSAVQSLRIFGYALRRRLANALTTLQAYINHALCDLLDVCCVAYPDDILIYSNQHGGISTTGSSAGGVPFGSKRMVSLPSVALCLAAG